VNFQRGGKEEEMLKVIRRVGSLAFVLGFFSLIFVVIPWYVTVVDNPDVGGPLPGWVRGAVCLLLGGIAVVLISVAIEQRRYAPKTVEPELAAVPTGILMENTDRVPGREVTEALGLVRGHTIYAIWLGKDISALMRLLLGGELTEYTEMMGKAREVALQRMVQQAAELGADAVVNVRFMTSSVIGSAAELLAYGTAVKLAPTST
jgi:uncharacterized protein YbjQ (UPF0145 family)